MLKIALLNIKGEKIKDITLNSGLFGIEPNDTVVYNAVVSAQASSRQGTSKVKTRSEVSGGGRKPHPQKKTGNARAGSIRDPQWRGGGIVFGPTPRSYDRKMNKKERRLALKSALTYKVNDKELIVVENLDINTNKTKDMLNLMETLKINGSALIVVKELTDNLVLASRNLGEIKLIAANELNTLDVITYNYLVVTEDALKLLEEVLI